MTAKSKIKLLNPLFSNIPTRIAVIKTAGEFYGLQDAREVPFSQRLDWPLDPDGRVKASTCLFPDDGLVVVAYQPDTPAELIPVVVHESIHVFEAIMRDIGEDTPSEEFRAYGTEAVFRAIWQEILAQGVDTPKTAG